MKKKEETAEQAHARRSGILAWEKTLPSGGAIAVSEFKNNEFAIEARPEDPDYFNTKIVFVLFINSRKQGSYGSMLEAKTVAEKFNMNGVKDSSPLIFYTDYPNNSIAHRNGCKFTIAVSTLSDFHLSISCPPYFHEERYDIITYDEAIEKCTRFLDRFLLEEIEYPECQKDHCGREGINAFFDEDYGSTRTCDRCSKNKDRWVRSERKWKR